MSYENEINPVSKTATKRIVASFEMTEDMARTLYFYFDKYEVSGVVKVEALDDGSLWLPHYESGTRQFLGSTKPLGRYDA